jgi:hypothetical protein
MIAIFIFNKIKKLGQECDACTAHNLRKIFFLNQIVRRSDTK